MRMLDRVVALNLSLVMAHQADAAYWKEWEMRLFNLGAFLLLLVCFAAVVSRRPAGLTGSWVIAGLSGIVLPIHAGFAIAGFTQFHLPVSISIIVGTFVVSVWQASVTWRARSEFSAGT